MSELPKPGELFEGRYELLDILGSGGVGTVFRALQTDINRYVAIKILHQHIAVDPEFRQRFLREAQALNKLNHPNVVSVYHMGLTRPLKLTW